MTGDYLPCVHVVELLTDYLEGALDPATTARVDAHLAVCEPCTIYLGAAPHHHHRPGNPARADPARRTPSPRWKRRSATCTHPTSADVQGCPLRQPPKHRQVPRCSDPAIRTPGINKVNGQRRDR